MLANPVRHRFGLIHFVDGNHHGHFRGAGVVDGLKRLRHHTVIGGHHQHHDVRHLGAARPHQRKGLVAGRVEEDDLAVLRLDLISADVLRDTPCLPGRDVRFANRVQKRRFAVVHMAHHRDHGRARHQIFNPVGLLDFV